MFPIIFSNRIPAALAALVLGATAVSAASITVEPFDPASHNTVPSRNVFQDFETLGQAGGEREIANGFATNVGTFSTLGGLGSGGTVVPLPGPDAIHGNQLALRTGNVYGRDNTSPGGGAWFLDSNDTHGMVWDLALAGGGAFSRVSFTLTDAADVGAYLRISTGSDSHEMRSDDKLDNGNEVLVTIDFGGPVTGAQIILANYQANGIDYRRNDGFSIDGIQVAPIPLPAAVSLLAAALAALGLVGRRRRAA
ncbi:MAG: putative extracellular protein [Rhodobacteraceae bacterium HLUCCA08]|nr:MAG: putative extracellular protein [Rhodobacteraceae bacterium HLUCCA08]